MAKRSTVTNEDLAGQMAVQHEETERGLQELKEEILAELRRRVGRVNIHEIASRARVVRRLEDLSDPTLFKDRADFERFHRHLQEARRGAD